jgi:hypothetical protein
MLMLAFVADPAVERFDIAVAPRLPWQDDRYCAVTQCDTPLPRVPIRSLAATDQSRSLDLFACREAWAHAPSSRHLV